MNGRSCSTFPLCLLPVAFLVAGCAKYTLDPQPAAYVYVSTVPLVWGADPSLPRLILAFSATRDGALTPVQTLPLGASELMVAANSNSVYTVASGGLTQHEILAGGTLKASRASINTQAYGGSACGQPSGSGIMDRTGQHLTVELYSTGEASGGSYMMLCDTWQTYQVQPGGAFVFEGYDDSDPYSYLNTGTESLGVSAVSGNNQFAYGVVHISWSGTAFTMMQRDSTGILLRVPKFGEVDPSPDSAQDDYFPLLVSADSSNHLAVIVYAPFATNPASENGRWLASYTIDGSTGAIQSTNSYANMPQLALTPSTLALSPTGDFAAVGGYSGLQIFHFNGADPATADGGILLPKLMVNQVAWDNDHHLYVLAQTNETYPVVAQFSLYVYTVTEAGISLVARSPWSVPNGDRLIVVPKP